jgi:hypothetical protein
VIFRGQVPKKEIWRSTRDVKDGVGRANRRLSHVRMRRIVNYDVYTLGKNALYTVILSGGRNTAHPFRAILGARKSRQ